MFAILKKELNSFFCSLIAYVIIGFFLLAIGLFTWFFPYSNVLDIGYADLQPLFVFGPYILMLLIPAITMGALAEERKIGTLEIVLTSSIQPIQLILGKYMAYLVIIVITLLLTSSYYITIYMLAHPTGNVDTAAIVGSYIGLILLAATFASIGLFASSLTESQIVAFLISILVCFGLYQGFEAWSTLKSWKNYAWLLSQCGFLAHYENISQGVIDSRDIMYYVSMMIIFITATNTFLKEKR